MMTLLLYTGKVAIIKLFVEHEFNKYNTNILGRCPDVNKSGLNEGSNWNIGFLDFQLITVS